MNSLINRQNRFMTKDRRKQKPVQPGAGRRSMADPDEEWLGRTLREKIELAVEECCVWPN